MKHGAHETTRITSRLAWRGLEVYLCRSYIVPSTLDVYELSRGSVLSKQKEMDISLTSVRDSYKT